MACVKQPPRPHMPGAAFRGKHPTLPALRKVLVTPLPVRKARRAAPKVGGAKAIRDNHVNEGQNAEDTNGGVGTVHVIEDEDEGQER